MEKQALHARRGQLSGGLTALGGLLAVVVGLAIIDYRVRDHLAGLVAGRRLPSGELASFGARLQDLLLVVLQAVRDQSLDHAPLVIFALAATVLVLFMLRS
jgi:hypothetical protein